MIEQEGIITSRYRTLGSGILKWFGRPRVTLTIIVVLLVLYALGLVIPQKPFFASQEHYESWLNSHRFLGPVLEGLRFTDIYTSPVTLFFLVLFYLNLILVVARRVPYILRKAMLTKDDDSLDFEVEAISNSGRSRKINVEGVEPHKVKERIKAFFSEREWFVKQSENGERTFAVRNRLSSLGFLLFHLSFVLCLSGGLMIYYTRFSARTALTEGEAFTGNFEQFYSISRQPKAIRGLEPIAFILDEASMTYETAEQEWASSLDAIVRVQYKGQETVEHVKVNQPVRKGDYALLALNLGGSPLFVLSNVETGEEIDGAWVRLDAAPNREDFFRFENAPEIEFRARFFPDYIEEGGSEGTRSLNILNPAYHVTVRHDESIIAEATVKPGEAIVFKPFVLEFRAMRRWVDFQLVREMGAGPLVAGFSIAVVGLMMRLIFYRREIRVAHGRDGIWLTGKSEFYAHSFEEEMDDIATGMREYIMAEDGRKEGAGV